MSPDGTPEMLRVFLRSPRGLIATTHLSPPHLLKGQSSKQER